MWSDAILHVVSEGKISAGLLLGPDRLYQNHIKILPSQDLSIILKLSQFAPIIAVEGCRSWQKFLAARKAPDSAVL